MRFCYVRFIFMLLWLGISNLAMAQLPEPSQALIAAAQAQREALFDRRGIDVSKLSQEIGAAVRDGEKLERESKYQEALDRLLALEKYMPLLDVPSFDVHMLAGWLHSKLGRSEASLQHRQRAVAYRTVLWQHIGKGDSADDPLRVVMVNEIVEWNKSQLNRIADSKSLAHRGVELTVVTYQGPTTGNQPRQLFAEIDKRTRAMSNRALDRFSPIPVTEMRPQDVALLAKAREKRAQFLSDQSFSYYELREVAEKLTKDSMRLDMDGKPQEALAKLREIEKIRDIEDIPTPRLLSWYSYLMGKTGNAVKQQEMRGLIFGVQQAMAHSGDGGSIATAIHVILVQEEYEWLGEKKLKLVRQALREAGDQQYDVMTVQNPQGIQSDIFFNITKLFARQSQLFAPAK
jgi:tetratricopeptide (TPR) repeat protein